MKEIIGKTINAIYIGDGGNVLAFDTDAGVMAYETEADCCSSTWFAEITGVDALLGNTVLTAEDMEIPDSLAESMLKPGDGSYSEGEEKFYGVKLTTPKGHIDIIYRNASNGYYGGSINFIGERKTEGFAQVTADWAA